MFITDSIEYLESFREETGNEYLDIRTAAPAKRAKAIIDSFREAGIEKFAFSSIGEGAIITASVFQECGCELEGLTKVNDLGGHTIPAYLFKVN